MAERNTRAMEGQPRMPMAMNTFWMPLPSTAIMAITKSVYGNAMKMSAQRMMMVSQIPP